MAVEVKVTEFGTGQWTTLDASLRDRFLAELGRVRGGAFKQWIDEWLTYLPPSRQARIVRPDLEIVIEDGAARESIHLSAGQVLQGDGRRARYMISTGDDLMTAAGIDV